MKLVLQQKQQVNLVMTTELRQAIELLQYSTQDLYKFLKDQELENPLLELVEKEETYDYKYSSKQSVLSNEDYVDPLDFVANDEESFNENLLEQVTFKKVPKEMKSQLNYLILNLDENGYLSFDKHELARDLKLNELEIDKLIKELQTLEPIGIGAIDLADCLSIQLNYYYPENKLAKRIVALYLSDLANKKWQEISEKENVTLHEIQEAFEVIRTLNPKPASQKNSKQSMYITPDIIVKYEEHSEAFIVHLNDHYIPNVKFNQSYLQPSEQAGQLDDYVQNQYKNYKWIKNSIEQRRDTIIKIMNVLLNEQLDFMTKGLNALKPLTLKEVALMIDMHESTISRATDNKIIQTPAGTFELKELFSTRLITDAGIDKSQTQVKNILKTMIKNEDKYKPLSDQKIVEQMFADKGIKISRRTIAKYRDELNIPSSSRRKEIKLD